MLAHLLGQKTVDLYCDVARIRARRGPGARKRAGRAAHVERAETILGTPQGRHDGVHVLHVLELQVRGVRRVDRGRFDVAQEQRRARTVPADTGRTEIRVEGDVA